MTLLQGLGLRGGYGGADILHGCDICAERGEITVVVGPNGAGKSTAMRALIGLTVLREGRVLLDGEDVKALSPPDRVRAGMAFVPQTRNVFPSMTVEENLEMGALLRRSGIAEAKRRVYALFPALAEKRRQQAGELSGGQRQQVALGRAMMTEPAVLMLDEPTASVSPMVMDELFERILAIAADGVAVLMVEQNARQALEIADRGHVLVNGRNKFNDRGSALLAAPEVRRSFLGGQ